MKIFFYTFLFAFCLFFSQKNTFAQVYANSNTNTSKVIKNIEFTHAVEEGEYLLTISKKYGVKIQDIRTWNNLKNDALSMGQKLVIFAKHIEETHTIKAGENLQELSHIYGVSPKNILEWNNLKNENGITEGQNVKIYILKHTLDK